MGEHTEPSGSEHNDEPLAWFKGDAGIELVEYALLAALLVGVLAALIPAFPTAFVSAYTAITDALTAALGP